MKKINKSTILLIIGIVSAVLAVGVLIAAIIVARDIFLGLFGLIIIAGLGGA